MLRGERTYPDAKMSQRRATAALTNLLYFCTVERLAGFTAAGLSASYNVPPAKCAEMLAAARKGRCHAFRDRRPHEAAPTATSEHMPFFDHRTMAEVIEDEARRQILRSLGQ